MAAPDCHACGDPILGRPQTCSFCARHYHPTCDPDDTHYDVGFVCSFGCRQAYDVGSTRAHRRRRQHRCMECGKDYSKACNLRRHQKTTHGGVRYGPCPCCTPPRHFVTKQKLRQHLQKQKELAQQTLQELAETDASEDDAMWAEDCGLSPPLSHTQGAEPRIGYIPG